MVNKGAGMKRIKLEGKKFVKSFILSYILSFILGKYFNILTFPMFYVLWGGTFTLCYLHKPFQNRYKNLLILIYSVLFATSICIVRGMETKFSVDILVYIGGGGYWAYFLISRFIRTIIKNEICFLRKETSNRKWLIISAVLFISWLPYFLMNYPGFLTIDSYSTIKQNFFGQEITNHHPILFTLFVGACMRLGLVFGDYVVGVAFFSIIQMCITALVLSREIIWINSKISNCYFHKAIIFAFFAYNPLIAKYSLTMWKDILFALWLLAYIMILFEIVESDGEWLKKISRQILFVIIGLLIILGRNNGIYILVFVSLFTVICLKNCRKYILALSLCSIIIGLVIQGPVYRSMGWETTESVEAFAIPLQQISYTICENGEITEEQKKFVEQLLDIDEIKKSYNPYTVDPIKFNDNFNNEFLDRNKMEFIKIWMEMLPHNLELYIKAYLYETAGYWYTGAENGKIPTLYEMKSLPQFKFKSFLGEEVRDRVDTLTNNLIKLPGIAVLFNIASSVWLTLFYIVLMIITKKYKYIIPVLPLCALWGTMMVAAPTFCEFRYMYAFHITLPIVMVMLFRKSEKKENCNI